MTQFTIPGLTDKQGVRLAELLQKQLSTDELDPVTQDLLIGQAGPLEKFQWFVRAHLESAGGKLAHEGSATEKSAARSARRKS